MAPQADGGLVFDADFLRKLERLEILARKIFRGLLRGERMTRRRGRGLEFSDFRRYRPGDDFRHIDWNIFSRLDRLFLKLYAAEEDVTLSVLLDASASMAFGDPAKFDHGRRIAAALAYIGLSNLDRVSVSVFADAMGPGTRALKSRHHMASLLRFLDERSTGGKTRFHDVIHDFATRNRNPGLVILISDLMFEDDCGSGLDVLRHHGHDVAVVQILCEEEIEPALDGALRLIDAEAGSRLDIGADQKLRDLYKKKLDDWLRTLEDDCRRRAVEYLRASTVIPFEDVILKYLRQGAFVR